MNIEILRAEEKHLVALIEAAQVKLDAVRAVMVAYGHDSEPTFEPRRWGIDYDEDIWEEQGDGSWQLVRFANSQVPSNTSEWNYSLDMLERTFGALKITTTRPY